jgi:hypothetical protein
MPTAVVHMDHFIGDFDGDRRRDAIEQVKLLLTTILEAGGFGVVSPHAFGLFSRNLPPFTPPRPDAESRALLVAALTELGAHADTFHMSVEESDIGGAIRKAGAHIKHVQLGDSNRLEPGAGHYDWPDTLDALEDIGYEGWLAMECGISRPIETVLPQVAALLKR